MKRKARGIALVELLVVIALVSVIISAVAICLHGMYRANRRTRESMAGRTAISRLSLRFRADAHAAVDAAVEVEASEKPASVVFSQPAGRTVEYRFERSRVLRVVRQDDEVAHRDAFRLPRRTEIQWESADDDKPFVSMVIDYVSESGIDETARQQRVEAAIGLHNSATQGNE